MKRTVLAMLFSLLVASPLAAQWLNYPTPGCRERRTANRTSRAPTPRTHNGTPDLSGMWRLNGLGYSFKHLRGSARRHAAVGAGRFCHAHGELRERQPRHQLPASRSARGSVRDGPGEVRADAGTATSSSTKMRRRGRSSSTGDPCPRIRTRRGWGIQLVAGTATR
jgi:hypothetical protein